MVVIYLGLATAVTMKTIDLTKNQEIQLLSQLLIEVVFCYLFKITKIRHKSEKLVVAPEEGLFKTCYTLEEVTENNYSGGFM